jgi:hypothetical protein
VQRTCAVTCDLAVLVPEVGEVREHQVQEALLAVVAQDGDGTPIVVLLRQLQSDIWVRVWNRNCPGTEDVQ